MPPYLPLNPSDRDPAIPSATWSPACPPKNCRRADNGAQLAHERIIEQSGAEEAQPFFGEGCWRDWLAPRTYRQAQSRLSTGAGVRGRGCRRQTRGGCPLPLGAGMGSYLRFWQTSPGETECRRNCLNEELPTCSERPFGRFATHGTVSYTHLTLPTKA